MGYNTNEISQENGSPIELYDIVLGTDSWHFTSGEDEIVLSGTHFLPVPIKRDQIPIGTEERKQELSLTLPASHTFVQKYIIVVPGTKATVTIRRFHRYDLDMEVVALFKGIVSAVKFSDNGATAQVGVAPITTSLSLPVPRYLYSGLCNNVLGDRWCTVDLETGTSVSGKPYKFTGPVALFSSLHLQITGIASASYPDQFFQGGRIVTAAGDTRLITSQTGDDIYIYVPLFEGIALLGQNVNLFAGCDHGLPTCQTKFGNAINYSGFPTVPNNNIFTTGLQR